MKEIQLTHGQVAVIDDDDFEELSKHKWFALASPARSTGRVKYYAARTVRNGKRWKTLLMHKVILFTPGDLRVDHKDGNSLNNQRNNLRVATNKQNAQNRPPSLINKLGLKGVDKVNQKFRARIKIDEKAQTIGIFSTPTEAAKAYDAAAKKHFGEFAYLNFKES